jgi:DNA-binding transcriptional MerR regulator
MMEEELISKKELLELTNISYGQLYRWKRKGLIPEEWFIRKSTFTGQETFFPKYKVLPRIDKILSMKEDVSLDDLADVFSPAEGSIALTAEEAVQRGIASSDIVKLYLEFRGGNEALDFNDLLCVHLFGKHLSTGDISLDEGKLMLEVLREQIVRFGGKPAEIYLTRKLGVFCCFAASPPCDICFDKNVRLIARTSTVKAVEELKLKLV